MIRLDLSYFYRLALVFREAASADGNVAVSEIWLALYRAEQAIEILFNDRAMAGTFRRAHASGTSLYAEMREVRLRPWTEIYTDYDKARIDGLIDQFVTILQSELSVADAYYVVQKRGLDTIALVSEGEVLFPESLPEKVPEAIPDLREAAKCIAFELSTASGFHLMRVVESVIRRYWEVVTGNKPKPKQRNIGTYIRGLKAAKCGDEKVLAALQQLKDLHRNVITHTEAFLDVDKAVSLLGMCRSVVDAMLDEIPISIISPEPAVTAEFPSVPMSAAVAALGGSQAS
jgi:hypothetical protein